MTGVSLAKATGPVDFLALHQDGRSGALEFGTTGVDAVPSYFTRTPHDLGVVALTLVADGELELVFDEAGLLGAVNFGFGAGDVLPDGTLTALRGDDVPTLMFDGIELGPQRRIGIGTSGAQFGIGRRKGVIRTGQPRGFLMRLGQAALQGADLGLQRCGVTRISAIG